MKRLQFVLATILFVTLSAPAAPNEPVGEVTRVPVIFSGGHDTDPRDGGRPVVLIAAGLGVSPEVFREAFSHVRPAPAGREPEPNQVRQNKAALLAALGKYGVTNEKLDEVSNYYRYVPGRDKLWPVKPAIAFALVKNGEVIGYDIKNGGAGYSSPPAISVANVKGVKPTVELSFGKLLDSNGSVADIIIPDSAKKPEPVRKTRPK